jgi:hypothetical protein
VNFARILCCLLSAVGTATSSSDAPADAPPSTATRPSQRTIEILIAGPEDARNSMEATIRPLLGSNSDLRWTARASVPSDGDLPGSSERGAAQIWIDASSPMQVRVYLPSAEPKGATTVRTLARAAADGEDADLLAREAVAQIVKAAVLALRGELAQVEEAAPTLAASQEKRTYSSSQGAHGHDGLYLRLAAGYGYLKASESYGGETDPYSEAGPTLNAAIGYAMVGNLILYGEFGMTRVTNASGTRNGMVINSLGPPSYRQDLTLFGFGPGISYYLPLNLYVSGTLTLAKLWFVDDYANFPPPDTDWGIGGSLAVGKEWWISRNWGIGIAARVDYASMKHHLRIRTSDKSYTTFDPWMHVTRFSLLLSATYN